MEEVPSSECKSRSTGQ